MVTLEQAFEILNRGGSRITRTEPEPPLSLGLAESWRIIRPARDGAGVYAVWRDIYWLGLQQATHVIKITRWEITTDELVLYTDRGEKIDVEPLTTGPDFETMKEFREHAGKPDSGYPEAELIQAPALERFVDGLESRPSA